MRTPSGVGKSLQQDTCGGCYLGGFIEDFITFTNTVHEIGCLRRCGFIANEQLDCAVIRLH